ncbi:hypothetical protein AC249_AIPGENE12150 [Exaiptasia diaphana]|nr:hypothetical protein AC249_AIPGENE12150 [Exaiptasia diaphana]
MLCNCTCSAIRCLHSGKGSQPAIDLRLIKERIGGIILQQKGAQQRPNRTNIMMRYLQAFILLAALVMCCVTHEVVKKPITCMDCPENSYCVNKNGLYECRYNEGFRDVQDKRQGMPPGSIGRVDPRGGPGGTPMNHI